MVGWSESLGSRIDRCRNEAVSLGQTGDGPPANPPIILHFSEYHATMGGIYKSKS